MGRLIIFGDIHGCLGEWRELLDLVEPKSKDTLASVGDIVAKGPESKACLDLAQSLDNFHVVLGNHDNYLLKAWQKGIWQQLPDEHRTVVDSMGSKAEDYFRYIDSWPLYRRFDECLLIHAGLRPGIQVEDQTPNDLMSLRTLNETGKPWYESYKGDELVVYGHWAQQGLNVRNNTIGLDSGCVYGGKLSAVILPERTIVSVAAKQVYQPIKE